MLLYADHLWDSPYVFTAYVALREKGIPFEARQLNLDAGEQRTPEYRKLSLTARVPAIDHDGFGLSESTAIVEYLEEAFAPPTWPRLLPEALHDRARARQLMGFLRSDLLPLRDERSTETMFYQRASAPLGPKARAAAEKLLFVAGELIRAREPHLFGEFSIADADLAFMLHRLILNGDAVPDAIRAYAEKQWARPSIQSFVMLPRPARAR